MNNKRKEMTEIEKEIELFESYKKKQKIEERLEIESKQNKSKKEKSKESKIEPEWENENEKVIDYKTLTKYIVSRDFLCANVYKPFFNFFKNSYVRVCLHNGYAICKIIDVIYGKEYKYPYKKHMLRTDKYLKLKHGDNEIVFPLIYISNSKIQKAEYDAQKQNEFLIGIIKDYNRVKKLMERKMSKDEIRKYEDEKRNFAYSFNVRKSYFKTDLVRKRKDAFNERKSELAKELIEVYHIFNDQEKPITDVQMNEYARKYNLKVPGGEVEKEGICIKKEK